METAILKVGGMTCGGCVRSVAGVLRSIPGVDSAEVSLERGEARVTYDPAMTRIARIKEAIEDAGYQAQ